MITVNEFMVFTGSFSGLRFISDSPPYEIRGTVKFVCDSCGKCCRSFGVFIRIERQLSGRDYYCRFGITKDLFLAHVLPEYADEISDDYEEESGCGSDNNQKKCAFLKKNLQGDGFACAIYSSRPAICREYQCYRMLIYNKDGHVCGKVIGRNELQTADEGLANLWKNKVAHLPPPASPRPTHLPHKNTRPDTESHIHGSHVNDTGWAATVVTILKAHGYTGDPVE